MFQDMDVKMRKMEARLGPRMLPGPVRETKKITAAGKKPKMGTDWRMSRMGSSTRS